MKKNNGANVNKKDFIGKTIVDIDISAINQVVFTFDDGSQEALEVEAVMPSIGLYGISQVKN